MGFCAVCRNQDRHRGAYYNKTEIYLQEKSYLKNFDSTENHKPVEKLHTTQGLPGRRFCLTINFFMLYFNT